MMGWAGIGWDRMGWDGMGFGTMTGRRGFFCFSFPSLLPSFLRLFFSRFFVSLLLSLDWFVFSPQLLTLPSSPRLKTHTALHLEGLPERASFLRITSRFIPSFLLFSFFSFHLRFPSLYKNTSFPVLRFHASRFRASGGLVSFLTPSFLHFYLLSFFT